MTAEGVLEALRVLVTVVVGMAWIGLGLATIYSAISGRFDHQNDFSVFWTAGRLALEDRTHLYDPTAMQSGLAALGMKPLPVLAHPPTALLLFTPTALLPFWTSFVAWVALSATLFGVAAWRLTRLPAMALALLSPPVLQSLWMGQASLILSSAAIFGLLLVERRPILGAFLMGFVAAMKPQLFLVAPIILWPERRALAGLVLGGLSAFALSLLFGPYLWRDWLAAIAYFQDYITSSDIMRKGVSPASLAVLLGLPRLPVQLVGIVAGISLAWRLRTGTPQQRLFGLIAGSILCSPYALLYDLSALTPLIAAALLTATWRGIGQAVGLSPIAPALFFPVTVASFAATGTSRPSGSPKGSASTTAPLPS